MFLAVWTITFQIAQRGREEIIVKADGGVDYNSMVGEGALGEKTSSSK